MHIRSKGICVPWKHFSFFRINSGLKLLFYHIPSRCCWPFRSTRVSGLCVSISLDFFYVVLCVLLLVCLFFRGLFLGMALSVYFHFMCLNDSIESFATLLSLKKKKTTIKWYRWENQYQRLKYIYDNCFLIPMFIPSYESHAGSFN